MSNSKNSRLLKPAFSKTGMLVFVLAFGVIGGIIALGSFALTPQSGQGTAIPNSSGQAQPALQANVPAGLPGLATLLSHYGQQANSSQGDLNGDGKVTSADLSILLSGYGQQ